MKKFLFILILFGSCAFGGTITLAVAANVSYAMDELKAEFVKTHPHTKVRVTLGSSGKLTAQIIHGAPYGLFMSADMLYPKKLYDEGVAITKPLVYAKGSLALFSTKKQDFLKGLELLKEKTIRTIAIANPKTAPYGKAAMMALRNAKIYKGVKSKFIYGESIAQTISYALSAADIGIVAKSSLFGTQMKHYKEGKHWSEIDPKLYTPIEQGVVLLKYAKNNKEYKAFYEFLFSKEAKMIFQKYGYILP